MPGEIESERETGVACPCVTEERPEPDPACPVCHGRGWLTVTEWRAAKVAGLFPKP